MLIREQDPDKGREGEGVLGHRDRLGMGLRGKRE